MGGYRTVEVYKDYTIKFLDSLPKKARDKCVWTLQLIEEVERVPATYLKHLEDGIFEIRVKNGSNIYRIMSFFDQEKIILTINGFQKKTRKTPKSELLRAKKIRNEYYEEKGR